MLTNPSLPVIDNNIHYVRSGHQGLNMVSNEDPLPCVESPLPLLISPLHESATYSSPKSDVPAPTASSILPPRSSPVSLVGHLLYDKSTRQGTRTSLERDPTCTFSFKVPLHVAGHARPVSPTCYRPP